MASQSGKAGKQAVSAADQTAPEVRECDYCHQDFAGVGKYLYPAPHEADNRIGRLACPKCAPAKLAEQVETGKVVIGYGQAHGAAVGDEKAE